MSLTDLTLPLQRAVVKALKDDGDLTALIGKRVYDFVPPNATFPYVSYGPHDVVPELAEDTDASNVTIQIDVWSRDSFGGGAKEIGAAVIAALHDELLPIFNEESPSVPAGAVQSCLLESARYLRDPDGLTSHGILTFNILVDANSP